MELQTWTAPPGEPIPNHPRWPVLIYRGVVVGDGVAWLEGHGWGGTWTDGVFDFHHFHSTSHEALAIVAGSATLELGGPQGEAFDVTAGDLLVLPAPPGIGPRRLHRRRRLPARPRGLRPPPHRRPGRHLPRRRRPGTTIRPRRRQRHLPLDLARQAAVRISGQRVRLEQLS
jgi:hypothetical protein